jgi:hypothetical protein
MAYGVKYRLIFSDVLGNGKKVEILKKDYTGDVLPMIGGANPVQISWQSSDDFYKPIIGSKCTLSLLVTDTIQYDDFYKFDEREFKVVVSYAKSQGEIYADRVEADGGTCESFECVDNVLNNFETISTYYQNRVIEDGGEVESLSCVADAITDDNFYRWGAYWSGFLVVDRYKEKMTTPPFGITINAFDGLGTLNNFNAPISYNNNNAPTAKNNLTRIQEILENLDLELDIFIASDIKGVFLGTTNNIETSFSFIFGYSEMKGDFGLYSAKEMLEKILIDFNCRIFQSFNRWYIVEASNIFDYYVKDQIFNEVQSTGVVPTGIRERISTQLENTKNEFIDFRTYDKDGTSLGTKRLQVLYDNNNQLKATNNDLAREYLQPVSEVVTVGEYVKTKSSFFNSGFEYGSYNFEIDGIRSVTPPFPVITPYAEIATDEISFKGRRSMKLTSDAPTSGQSICFKYVQPTFNPQKVKYDDFTIKLKYYIKFLSSAASGVTSTLQFSITTSDADGLKSWNAEEKTFQSGVAYVNQITLSNANVFINYSTTLSNEGLNIGSSTSRAINLIIYNTVCSSSDYETTFFDNVEIEQKKAEPQTADQNFTSKLINAGTKTSIKTRKAQPSISPGTFRTRENYGSYNTTNLFRGLTDIINQNIANDFRDFATRYEGTFRNLKVQPLSMHNKVWFYWTGFETDPQSTIIDGLKYDVKNASFKLKSHLPNDDDDVDIDFIVN